MSSQIRRAKLKMKTLDSTTQERMDSVEHLVRYLAKSFSRDMNGTSIGYDDLIAEGNIAIWNHASSYDPSRHNSFASYISPILRNTMRHIVRNEKAEKRLVAGRYLPPGNNPITVEERLAVLEALDHPELAPTGKDVIQAKYMLNRSNVPTLSEIGAEIGRSHTTVSNREEEALDTLRKLCA